MRSVLALDLATRTGWACGPPNGEPRFGTKVLPSTDEDVGSFVAAYEEWLNDMLAIETPAVVVFEAPILAQRTTIATARKLMGLAVVTELVTLKRQTRVREVHLQQVKKFFGGNGRAEKADMIVAARRHGWQVKDDNQADALGVWTYAVHTLAPAYATRFRLGLLGAA